MTIEKTYGRGFDRALGDTDRGRYRRWYHATSRVVGHLTRTGDAR